MNADRFYTESIEWKHTFTKKYTIDKYLSTHVKPQIDNYRSYTITLFITEFMNKDISQDIKEWIQLLISDNPDWNIMNDFFERCEKTGGYYKDITIDELLALLDNLSSKYNNASYVKSSDKFITINNIHIYPIIISQDKKENYLNIIVHNKGPLYIF
ncbi:MAG: hypothetical protein CMH79_04710 [Nitrospinae bacterium]|nr:hypothetical protein [Nitrospinota bacterium]|tara:strand:- start:89 stop:559 length:471 start_codon:yes stop_codon:yes gene_type:complete